MNIVDFVGVMLAVLAALLLNTLVERSLRRAHDRFKWPHLGWRKRDGVLHTVCRSGGGIYKRIDENRELLELLQAKAPDFLQAHDWVYGWLQHNDKFLTDLEAVTRAALHGREDLTFRARHGFPRSWPSVCAGPART